jgi:hypothetical protein
MVIEKLNAKRALSIVKEAGEVYSLARFKRPF